MQRICYLEWLSWYFVARWPRSLDHHYTLDTYNNRRTSFMWNHTKIMHTFTTMMSLMSNVRTCSNFYVMMICKLDASCISRYTLSKYLISVIGIKNIPCVLWRIACIIPAYWLVFMTREIMPSTAGAVQMSDTCCIAVTLPTWKHKVALYEGWLGIVRIIW